MYGADWCAPSNNAFKPTLLRGAGQLGYWLPMDAQQLLDDALPMLDDVLGRIGIHKSGTSPDFQALAPRFCGWLESQEISPRDTGFLVMIVGAFITEYLVQQRGATRLVTMQRPAVRVEFHPGVAREFDPYAAAAGLVQGNRDLRGFLSLVGS